MQNIHTKGTPTLIHSQTPHYHYEVETSWTYLNAIEILLQKIIYVHVFAIKFQEFGWLKFRLTFHLPTTKLSEYYVSENLLDFNNQTYYTWYPSVGTTASWSGDVFQKMSGCGLEWKIKSLSQFHRTTKKQTYKTMSAETPGRITPTHTTPTHSWTWLSCKNKSLFFLLQVYSTWWECQEQYLMSWSTKNEYKRKIVAKDMTPPVSDIK